MTKVCGIAPQRGGTRGTLAQYRRGRWGARPAWRVRAAVRAAALLAALAVASPARADPPPSPLTLAAAIEYALARQPALHTARAGEQVAAARAAVARADALPQAGVSGQLLRGTGNVLPGSIFPMPGIPSITGPPMTPPRFDGGAWGSAVGVWGAWDVTDLVRRIVLIDAALADERTARAGTEARRLAVAYDVADAFIAALDARAAVRATEATLARAQAFATQVHVLADQQLRPGADAARADAEVAFARIALARAEQARAVRDARLAEALGAPGARVELAPGALLDPAPAPPRRGAARAPEQHPLLVEADRAIAAAQTRERAAGLEYLPRVALVAALWLRGSGYGTGSAANLGPVQGLLPDTPNWAAGIVLSWPVMEMFAVRARARVAAAQTELARARRAEIAQAISGQMDAARAVLDGALAVARNTAPALEAARASERQARARYQAGLATAVDVADADRVLAQAELEDADARLAVRRAMLLVARAAGDLSPFLLEARGAAPGAGRP